jgi:hypothetical protein
MMALDHMQGTELNCLHRLLLKSIHNSFSDPQHSVLLLRCFDQLMLLIGVHHCLAPRETVLSGYIPTQVMFNQSNCTNFNSDDNIKYKAAASICTLLILSYACDL